MRRPLALMTAAITVSALALTPATSPALAGAGTRHGPVETSPAPQVQPAGFDDGPSKAKKAKKPKKGHTPPCPTSEQFPTLGLAGRHEDVTMPLVPLAGDTGLEQSIARYTYRLDLSGSADVPNATQADVRFTLTWDDLSDLDLKVYDAAGTPLGQGAEFTIVAGALERVFLPDKAHCTDLRVEIHNFAGLPTSNVDLDVTVALPVTPAARAAPEPCDPDFAVTPSPLVPQPTVTGPIGDEGIRTGEPYAATLAPLPDGWVEEEFFFSGTARQNAQGAADGAYTQRILVRRPTDPAEFNGTIVFNWNNVTLQDDGDTFARETLSDTLYDRGFAFVGVSVQWLGTEGSRGLKRYDPVRYASLEHPGPPGSHGYAFSDTYSYDIFSQAAEAAITPKVMGELLPCVQRRLAMGTSQSHAFLDHYVTYAHRQALVFDGFQPQINVGACAVWDVLVPVLIVQSQADWPCPDDSDLFRVWELPGSAHINYHWTRYLTAQLTYDHSNGVSGSWDPEEAGAWGYQAPAHGACLPDNYYPASYSWGAALVALDDWVRTGVAPESQPRLARDADGVLLFDDYHNALGGVRSPFVDVPIATYYVAVGVTPALKTNAPEPCGLSGQQIPLKGSTLVFDTEDLEKLYPTPEDYLEQFDAAVERALSAGTLLPEGAEDLRRRAVDAAAFIAHSGEVSPAGPPVKEER